MSAIGLAGEYFVIPDVIMLTGFIVIFACYVLVIRKITKPEKVK
jgi:UDP-GlcNAc:undecaprenyl-phosphate GlcNAc-1-phosphate transferase